MKKIIALGLFLLLLLPLCACGAEESTTSEAKKNEAEPLFRFKTAADREEEIVTQYLPLSDGFFYAHPTDTGFVAGFVSPNRSLSAEKIVEAEGSPCDIALFETEKDRALLFTPKAAYHLFLKEGSAQKLETDVPAVTNPVAHPAMSLVCENEDLVLLVPMDFSETLVLTEKATLTDFGHVLGTSADGRRIWYATQKDGHYTGIAYFEYGQKETAQSLSFSYDHVQSLGGTAFLFSRILEDQSAVYLYRDPENGITRAFTAPRPFDGVTADEKGTLLCGTRRAGDGGTVEYFSLESGALLGSFYSEYGSPAPAPSVDKTAATVFFAIAKGTDAMFATLSTK